MKIYTIKVRQYADYLYYDVIAENRKEAIKAAIYKAQNEYSRGGIDYEWQAEKIGKIKS